MPQAPEKSEEAPKMNNDRESKRWSANTLYGSQQAQQKWAQHEHGEESYLQQHVNGGLNVVLLLSGDAHHAIQLQALQSPLLQTPRKQQTLL